MSLQAHTAHNTTSDDIEDRVKRAGYKLTRQRRAVIEAVAASAEGLSAAELLVEAQRRCPRVGLATVYRTLGILDQIGGAERVHGLHARSAYVACPPTDHHHVVCVSCGKVADFHGCTVADMIPLVTEETGFTVEAHLLELLGTCRECRAKVSGRTAVRDSVRDSGGEAR